MLSWEKNFKSTRDDKRHLSSLAANLERLRQMRPTLSFNPDFNRKEYMEWQAEVKAKLLELLQLPPITKQPEPRRLWEKQREGYRVQKWEFFPEDWSVVPVLILIPDEVSESSPASAVLCFPGSAHSKEFLAGEELLPHPNCANAKFPDRNCMAKHYAQAGMIAVAFDNPGTAELSEFNPPDKETQWDSRVKLCGELVFSGRNYLGISVFQKMCFLEWFKKQNFVDASRIAVSGHSLGSEPAMAMGILDDCISAVVFNDFLNDERRRHVAVTNLQSNGLNDGGNWHIVPGLWQWFGFPDILAALAPKYLTINEGGAAEFLNKVRAGYRLFGCESHLAVNYYPKYAEPENRKYQDVTVPTENLSSDEFFLYSYVDVPDHSFRLQPSVPWLKEIFNIK